MTGARSIGLLFTDREAFRIIDLLRPFYAMTAVVAFFVTEAGRYVYRPLLHEMGLLFVGIDVIGGHLKEINVTSPTGIRELDEACGINIADQLRDTIATQLRDT